MCISFYKIQYIGKKITSRYSFLARSFISGYLGLFSFSPKMGVLLFASITATFNFIVTLPNNLKRGDCVLMLWGTENGDNVGLSLIAPSRNNTLYAVWKCIHIKENMISQSLRNVNRGCELLGDHRVP